MAESDESEVEQKLLEDVKTLLKHSMAETEKGLKYGELLQDDLINSFCDKLQAACPHKIEALFAVQFFSCVTEIGEIRRHISGEHDVFQVILEHERAHFVLVHYDPRNRYVYLYDSLMNHKQPKISRDVVELITYLFGHVFRERIEVIIDCEYERQRDAFSCGFRVIGAAIDLARGRNPARYSYDVPAILEFLEEILDDPEPSWESFENVEIGSEKEYTGKRIWQQNIPTNLIFPQENVKPDDSTESMHDDGRSLQLDDMDLFCEHLWRASPFPIDGLFSVRCASNSDDYCYRSQFSGKNDFMQILFHQESFHYVLVHYNSEDRVIRLYDSAMTWTDGPDPDPIVAPWIFDKVHKMLGHLYPKKIRISVPYGYQRQTYTFESGYRAVGAAIDKLRRMAPSKYSYDVPAISELIEKVLKDPNPTWDTFLNAEIWTNASFNQQEEVTTACSKSERDECVENLDFSLKSRVSAGKEVREEKIESGDCSSSIYNTVARLFSGIPFFGKYDEKTEFEEKNEPGKTEKGYFDRYTLGVGFR